MNERSGAILSSPEVLDELVGLYLDKPWLGRFKVQANRLFDEFSGVTSEKLLIHLLKHFHYVETDYIRDRFGGFVCDSLGALDIEPKQAIITTLSREDRADSGELLLALMRPHFIKYGFDSKQMISKLRDSVNAFDETFRYLIVLDDFTGTGKSLRRKIGWWKDKVNSESPIIIYVCLASMEAAREVIETNVDNFIVDAWLSKGITGHFESKQCEDKKKVMREMEKTLKIGGKYSLGFNGSESLYSLDSISIPNNVFPIFWCDKNRDDTERDVMFRRG